MTRRGSPEEQRWRDKRNRDPNFGGTVHGEQPVDPRGRLPREKPSGHRHEDPQPAQEHGSATHDGTVADNPHGNATHSPPMVENAVGAPSLRRETRAAQPSPANVAVGTRSVIEDEANVEEVAADTTGDGTADTWTPVSASESDHGNERHTPNMVENQVGSPSRRRENRADQPLPGDVAVGTESRIKDEGEILEVAADTDGDGVADTWVVASDPTHDHDTRYVNEAGDTMTGPLDVQGSVTVGDALFTSHGLLPTQFVTASDSRDRNIDNSDWQADGTSDQVTIQNAVDSLPVGTK